MNRSWRDSLKAPKKRTCKTFNELSDQLGIPSGTLRSWMHEGKIGGGRGKYNAQEVYEYALGLLDGVETVSKPSEAEQEGLERFRLARAAQEELKLAEMRHELVTTTSVRESYARTFAVLTTLLAAACGRTAAFAAESTDARQIEQRMRDEINAALTKAREAGAEWAWTHPQ